MQTKDIKQKIEAVNNIKKITKTMEMVSVAKMRRATNKANASKRYSDYGLELLSNISLDRDVKHPYVTGYKNAHRHLVIIIAANKGLCGAFNVNLSRKVGDLVNDKNNQMVDVICIGRQAERIAFRYKLNIVASFNSLGDQIVVEDAIALQQVIDKYYSLGEYCDVKIVYTRFVKALNYQVRSETLFPFRSETIEPSDYRLYTFEPNVDEIINSIVPGLIQSILIQYVLDSAASEHSSRMVAMKGASDNANSLLTDLKLSFNKVRQESITREISEIAAGADAVN